MLLSVPAILVRGLYQRQSSSTSIANAAAHTLRHLGPIFIIRCGAPGAMIYSYGTIKIWDLASMKELWALYGQSPVQSVTFSPDGKLLAATSEELRVWEVANGKEIITLAQGPMNRVIFSADGKWLAANPGKQSPGETMKIWNTQTWKEAGSLAPRMGLLAWNFDFSDAKSAPPEIVNASSGRFASGGESRTVWLSSVAMAVSPDGKWVAQPTLAPNGAVDIWDATSGQKLQSIPAHKQAAFHLSFSRNKRWLITVGQDSNPMTVQGQPGVLIGYPRVSVWDTATWKLEFSLTFPSRWAPGVDTSADGKFLAVSKGGGVTQLFDLEQKKAIAVLASPEEQSGSLAISPDGTILVQGAPDGILVWKLPRPAAGSN